MEDGKSDPSERILQYEKHKNKKIILSGRPPKSIVFTKVIKVPKDRCQLNMNIFVQIGKKVATERECRAAVGGDTRVRTHTRACAHDRAAARSFVYPSRRSRVNAPRRLRLVVLPWPPPVPPQLTLRRPRRICGAPRSLRHASSPLILADRLSSASVTPAR